MTTIAATDETDVTTEENPGFQLAKLREKKGLSQEYIAGKLHLRTRVIELLESDNYKLMPEPVFIKGYIRGYAKILNIDPMPFLNTFNTQHGLERKFEKTLWQSKRESNRGEYVIRWVTFFVVLIAITTIIFWWQKNKDMQPFSMAKNNVAIKSHADLSAKSGDLHETIPNAADKVLVLPAKPLIDAKTQNQTDTQISQLSPMKSMFSANNDTKIVEQPGG